MKRFLCALLFLIGCNHPNSDENTIASIHIIDRNGLTETISEGARIKALQTNDFLSSQPYKKVTRTLKKTDTGKVPSLITTYHANGQLWQYLEVLDGRAHGLYREFFPTGQKRLEATVIEGEGDLTQNAQDDWIFEGKNTAWDEQGHLVAEISYLKGFLEGPSIYYHPNGQIQRHVPYSRGSIQGTISHYDEQSQVIGSESFDKGNLNGISQFQGSGLSPAYRETYQDNKLIEGTYFDLKGQCIAEIRHGHGEKIIFEDGALSKKIEYHKGLPSGLVKLYAPDGLLKSEYHLHNEKKHGEEWIYHKSGQPKMLISWYDDQIHGTVKTWFENGVIESQKEMCHNMRHGHNFAWYKDGSLMLIEDYESGQLVKGSYMKKGSKEPITVIKNGNGFAALHDADGFFLKKIEYKDGKPLE